MRYLIFFIQLLCCTTLLFAQQPNNPSGDSGNAGRNTSKKIIRAVRTSQSIKVDGDISEAAWQNATVAKDFFEWRPNAGQPENEQSKTIVYLLYDNSAVYVAGYCYERSKDSISRELIGRDKVGVNDFVGVILDTYNDKLNAVGFYTTPYGEQFDAKYANNNEDGSWSAVWESSARILDNGWTFEMRIPYSALRFVSSNDQTWGLNITRRRNKTGQQYMWNKIDPNLSGFINQEGELAGIEKIETPLRLSLSPYFSTYLNHYPAPSSAKSFTSSINGGMDVKYGINDAFTLDMTLVPDFGQVRSDNQVLNLSPFEIKFNENRPFFTEGTELFSKGNLFYSRRIGGTPLNYGKAYQNLSPNEYVLRNPSESKLLNATKISGRTKGGLGLGFFNALSRNMYAVVADSISGEKREVETSPLTNYNILVADQTLKNNSSVSLINTSTVRSGSDYDANVTAAMFNLNNKKNSYNFSGKFALSQIIAEDKNTRGYSHNLGFAKTSGRWNFQIGQEVADDKYNINDLGILFNNNYIDHYLWNGFRWQTPTNWYNRAQLNFNAYYSRLLNPLAGQKINSNFQSFNTNFNGNLQLKNLWFIGGFVGYSGEGNDFYEARTTGYVFRSPRRFQFQAWAETNRAKPYSGRFNYFIGLRSLFNSPNHNISFSHAYRFSDKLSVSENVNISYTKNDAGYYSRQYLNNELVDVIFSRRDRKTIENVFSAKYNFNKTSGITFSARHYWSGVEQKQLYDLNADGTLAPTRHSSIEMKHRNFNIFNIDAAYTWEFAPGSFINIVWKDESMLSEMEMKKGYGNNFHRTLGEPQNNNLSLKVIYYLDYASLRGKLKKS